MGKRPNLIYVFADQWRRQGIGFRNEDPVKTPRMDRFAQESLVFNNAVSCTPLCSPHRASLMTGKYALSHGVFTNCKIGSDIMLSPDEIGIGDVLKESGYATGYIGKWHLDLPEQNVSEKPVSGARNWDAYTPPGAKRHGFDYWYSYGTYDQHLTPHYWENTPDMIQVEQWSVEHETDKAIEFLERQSNQAAPFALFLSWNPPHSPFELVPERYKELYKEESITFRQNVEIKDPLLVHTGETIKGGAERLKQYTKDYYAAISGLDEQFGRLLDQLEAMGFADNTIVVLTSDHGELLGSHGMMAKHSWHEESIGVPFLVRWPNRIPAGETDAVLNTVNIMPTLLELLHLPVPDTVEGTSMHRLLLNPAEDRYRNDSGLNLFGNQDQQSLKLLPDSELDSDLKQAAYISAFPGRKELLEMFTEAGKNNLSYGWRGMRSSQYTYVVDRGYFPENNSVTRLLYDLVEDPYQLNPIRLKSASEHPVAEKLEKQLKQYLAQTNDPFVLG